jgi:hypothetical protein
MIKSPMDSSTLEKGLLCRYTIFHTSWLRRYDLLMQTLHMAGRFKSTATLRWAIASPLPAASKDRYAFIFSVKSSIRVALLQTTPAEKLVTDGDLREGRLSILCFFQPKSRTERSAGRGVMRTSYANEFPFQSKGLKVTIMRNCAASGRMSFGECGKEVVLCGCGRWVVDGGGSVTVDGEWMWRWWVFRLIDW